MPIRKYNFSAGIVMELIIDQQKSNWQDRLLDQMVMKKIANCSPAV